MGRKRRIFKMVEGGKADNTPAETLPENVICYKNIMRQYRSDLSKLYSLAKKGYIAEDSNKIKKKTSDIARLKVWSRMQLSGLNKNVPRTKEEIEAASDA